MFSLLLLSALVYLVPSINAQTFALNTASYPTVADHHCISWVCGGVRWNSMHRDDQNTYVRNRRHAIGCDGVTVCGSGDSCDEIPYASTYDGGIGCFSQRWVQSGRSVNQLASLGSHMCVVDTHNSAHGSAVSTFYRQQQVPNFGTFNVAIDVNQQGCTSSSWCNRLFRAISGISGETVQAACTAARANGKHFERVGSSRYTRIPRCPSRGYRRDLTEIDDDQFEVTDANNSSALPGRLFRDDKGDHYFEMFGTVQEGDTIWSHDETLTNGTVSKVVAFTTMEEAFGHLDL